MELSEDYYEVLGIQRNADGDQIKKAYRKLALRWHPDKNLDKRELAESNFKRLSEAYEVLSDPRKRQIYDQCGKEGLVDGGGGGAGAGADFGEFPAGFNPFGAFGGLFSFGFRDPNDVFREFFGSDDPFSDFFSDMNAGNNNNHHHHHQQQGHPNSNTQPSSMFSNPFDLFGGMMSGMGGMGGMGGMSSMSMSMSGGGGANGGANVKKISTSVKTVNGKRIETKRIFENGVETVIVSENGQIKSKSVDGQPQLTG